MYGLRLTAGPAIEPVTATEAKLHARIDLTTEDTLVADWIKAAREMVEEYTTRKIVAQTWTLTMRRWPDAIRLPFEPVTSVTSVKYYDTTGTLTTLVADTDYQVWLDHSPPLIAPGPDEIWPTLQSDRLNPIEVVFVAGYTDPPARVKEAIYLTMTYWSENRGDAKDPTPMGLPMGAKRILDTLWTGAY